MSFQTRMRSQPQSSCCHPSKLKVQRELDLAGTGSGNGLPKSRHRREGRAEHRIDLGDVRAVEQVEEFRDYVETSRPAEWEILQDAQIHSRQCRSLQRVSAESQRSCRQRNGVTLVRVKTR